MKILAIDSSGLVATVALVEDNEMRAEYTVNYKKTHSETLVPMLDEIKRMIELDFASVDAIAVAEGPGSFTGLRIGSATAKGMAMALDKPIIPVPTVDAISYNLWGYDGIICPMMDARREQVYSGLYEFKDGEHFVLKEQSPLPVEEMCGEINKLGRKVCLLGDGIPVYKDKLSSLLTVPFEFAPAHMNRQRAGALAVLAMKLYKEGRLQTAAEHRPEYLRLSQAERERKENA